MYVSLVLVFQDAKAIRKRCTRCIFLYESRITWTYKGTKGKILQDTFVKSQQFVCFPPHWFKLSCGLSHVIWGSRSRSEMLYEVHLSLGTHKSEPCPLVVGWNLTTARQWNVTLGCESCLHNAKKVKLIKYCKDKIFENETQEKSWTKNLECDKGRLEQINKQNINYYKL